MEAIFTMNNNENSNTPKSNLRQLLFFLFLYTIKGYSQKKKPFQQGQFKGTQVFGILDTSDEQ